MSPIGASATAISNTSEVVWPVVKLLDEQLGV
jgi:hypothetical protein